MLKIVVIGFAIGGLISALLLAKATIWLSDEEQDKALVQKIRHWLRQDAGNEEQEETREEIQTGATADDSPEEK